MVIILNIEFYHVGIATCLLRVDEKIKIAIDPVLSPQGTKMPFKSFESTRIKDPKLKDGIFDGVDLWLITHMHKDHFDDLGMKAIDKDSPVIVHPCNAKNLPGKKTVALSWGKERKFSFGEYTVTVFATPAYHASNFLMRKVVGAVNGYILKIEDGYENYLVYFTSDTVFSKAIVKKVKKFSEGINLMVANLGEVNRDKFGGPLTMSIEMLSRFNEEIKPDVVIPVHIDDMSHYSTISQDVAKGGFNILPQGRWLQIY
ncbi:MAG: MBL fold metallo-hydrolase [Clostridiales bacterium]|jgi:L-ascorbate metabolism protein UlaG (beta-lactamase superfamily)|nr:MBL fold metallo-hydrolase [Clostridiales bacterium]